MVFSSFEFIGVFLPLFLLAYYFTWKYARPYRNTVIFLFSIGFYAYGAIVSGTPLYILLLFVSVIFNFAVGGELARLGKREDPPGWRMKAVLAFGIVIDFGILFLFKYADFVFGVSLGLALPIGISFYTFQIVSYIIDVYRDPRLVENSFVNLGAYIMMFPQLIAGPIVRFSTVRKDLRKRSESRAMFLDGIKTFVIGLGFKVIIANQLGSTWTQANTIGFESLSVPMAWLSMIAYSFQLFFDFYGYSLMAIGLGRMMGFEFPQNFDSPYISVSMTEFWRRWHMTLGTWFREYVYIPLGGNRLGKARGIFNLFVVWMLTGFWHGADWNFIIWGLFLFAVIAVERLGVRDHMESHRFAGHIYMILLIPLQWMVFAISDLKSLGAFYGRLVGIGGVAVSGGDWLTELSHIWWILLLALVLSTDLGKKLYAKVKDSKLVWIPIAGILAAVIYCLAMGLNDPFLYFRF